MKPVHRVEDEPSVREADEGLILLGAIPLEAGLEEVIATHPGDVVEHLNARVVRFHRNEERHPEAKARCEIHPGVGERTVLSRNHRSGVRTRPVLARELKAELVVDGVGEVRHEAAVDGVRVVPLDGVGAACPGIDVEGAVLLARVRVVVLERRVVLSLTSAVELDEPDLRVVGALDRAEVAGQRAAEGGS